MRLIDVDALIDAMDKRYKEKSGIVPDNLAEGFLQMEKLIGEQPTAYDVEKVVAELESEKFDLEDCRYDVDLNTTIDMAIEIVRNGGVQ